MTKLIAILGVAMLVAGGGVFGLSVYTDDCDNSSCSQRSGCCPLTEGGCSGASGGCPLSQPCCADEGDQAKATEPPALEAVVGLAAVVAKK